MKRTPSTEKKRQSKFLTNMILLMSAKKCEQNYRFLYEHNGEKLTT